MTPEEIEALADQAEECMLVRVSNALDPALGEGKQSSRQAALEWSNIAGALRGVADRRRTGAE